VHDDRTGEGDLGRGAVGGDLGDVGEETAAGLDGQPGGDLLALRGGRDDDGGRGLLLHELRKHLGLRRDQVVVDLGRLGDVDRRRAVLGQRVLHARGRAGGGDDDCRGLTERARRGEGLQGGLADSAAGRVELGQDQDLCHE
jgi:hypothetical protein